MNQVFMVGSQNKSNRKSYLKTNKTKNTIKMKPIIFHVNFSNQ